MNPIVSILIPVYNSEKYILQCIHSVFSQDYENIEYIIVNDATPDSSMKLINETLNVYPHRTQAIKIIEHETNQGIAATRNTLLKNATGNYVLFVDSDDFMEPGAIKSLVERAELLDPDIIRFAYFTYMHGKKRLISHPTYKNKEELLKQYIGAWDSVQGLWQLFVKREVFTDNNITFPKGINHCEDYLITAILFLKASSIVDQREAYYNYRIDNENSLTHQNKIKFRSDMISSTTKLIEYLKNNGIYDNYKDQVLTRMFLCKQNYLLDQEFRDIKKFINIYPESNYYYRKFNYNIKERFLFFLALHKQRGILELLFKII